MQLTRANKRRIQTLNTQTSQFNIFCSISMNTKSNCYPSYRGKSSKEDGNMAKSSVCNRRELLIRCLVLIRYSQHRPDCSSASKLGKGSTLNWKGYYIALIPNPGKLHTRKTSKPITTTLPKTPQNTNKSTPSHPLQKKSKAPKLNKKQTNPNYCSHALLKTCSTF